MAIVPRSRRERVFCNFRVCTAESTVFLLTTMIARFARIASGFCAFFHKLIVSFYFSVYFESVLSTCVMAMPFHA